VQAQPRGTEYLDRTKVKVGGLKEGTSLAVIKAAFEHAANCGRPRSEWISLGVEWLQSKRSQQPYDPDADLDAPLPEDQPPADGGKGRIAVVTVPDADTWRTVVGRAPGIAKKLGGASISDWLTRKGQEQRAKLRPLFGELKAAGARPVWRNGAELWVLPEEGGPATPYRAPAGASSKGRKEQAEAAKPVV